MKAIRLSLFPPSFIGFYMINFILDSFHITSILALSLGITAIGYSSSQSAPVTDIPVTIELPALSEIETEWLPEVTVEVVVEEIEIEHIPSHRVR